MKKLYSVFDSINCEYAQPFMLNNDAAAKDMFVKDIRRIAKQNLDKFHDLDINRYQLFSICDFDPESGCVRCDDKPILIYDVAKDFDSSIFDSQIAENESTKGMEVNNG